jgi:hypothetical protein
MCEELVANRDGTPIPLMRVILGAGRSANQGKEPIRIIPASGECRKVLA